MWTRRFSEKVDYSQNIRKQIIALGTKAKARAEAAQFIAEGTKCVGDLARLFKCHYLLATPTWIENHGSALPDGVDIAVVRKSDLERVSRLSTPSDVLGVFEQPTHIFSPKKLVKTLSLALDGIQDPGNLGTIIRVADWMGVKTILCSEDTVDAYNPKVVQATMGAIGRVSLIYTSLPEAISEIKSVAPEYSVYGTYLHGENIYTSSLTPTGMIVMGNEGHGISEPTGKLVNHPITIPTFSSGDTSESLNVAIATAITLSEFKRRTL